MQSLADAWVGREIPQTPKRRRDVSAIAGLASMPQMEQTLALAPLLEASCGLADLWEEGCLTDVELQSADGVTLPAHKVVLAAASPFFRAFFTGTGTAMQEGCAATPAASQVVELPGVAGGAMRAIVRAIYRRSVQITPDTIHELLAGSSLLQVTALYQACIQYLRSHITHANCLEVLQLSATYGTAELYADSLAHVCANFSDVVRENRGAAWQALPEEMLSEVLGSEELVVADSELEVFRSVVDWVAGDPMSRQPLLPSLLVRFVRLGALSPACLAREVAPHALVAGCSEAALLVGAAIAEQGGPKGAAPPGKTGALLAGSGPYRRTSPTGIIVLGGHDSGWRNLRSSELYDPQTDSWQSGPVPVLPYAMSHGLSFVSCATLGGELYTVGGSCFASPVAVYAAGAETFTPCASLLSPRVNMAVAACGGKVFALGGRTGPGVGQVLSSAEFFEPGASTWQRAAAMPTARASLGAATLGGDLYAVGGQSARAMFSSVDVMDASTGLWHTLPQHMLRPRKYVGVGALEGCLYAVGGMDSQRARLASVEALDPREGRWREAGAMSAARSSAGIAVLHGRLYAIGGNGCGDAVHSGVEVYEPAMDAWLPAAPIPTPRSGAGVWPPSDPIPRPACTPSTIPSTGCARCWSMWTTPLSYPIPWNQG